MSVENVLEHIDRLLENADALRPRLGSHTQFMEDLASTDGLPQGTTAELVSAWETRALHVLRMALGQSSEHYRRMDKLTSKDSSFERCIGVLRAARDDIADGLLSTVRELVTADIFDDLLASKCRRPPSGLIETECHFSAK